MELNTDFLINFYDKHSGKGSKKGGEMEEQDAGAAPAAPTSGGSGKSVPKWAEVLGFKQGKANPKTAGSPNWETGLTRNVGNQIW